MEISLEKDILYLIKIAERRYADNWSCWTFDTASLPVGQPLWICTNATTFLVARNYPTGSVENAISDIMTYGSNVGHAHGIIILSDNTKFFAGNISIDISHLRVT